MRGDNAKHGVIFYASRYGSTAQYAQWIGQATNLPVFDVEASRSDPAEYDFVVLGLPIIYHKLMARHWAKQHAGSLLTRPCLLVSVSGAGAGAKLDGWLRASLPAALLEHMDHVALRGRQNPKDLSWFDRMMLIVGGLKNRDRVAAKEEIHGFDFMDRASIAPIVAWVEAQQQTAMSDQEARVAQ